MPFSFTVSLCGRYKTPERLRKSYTIGVDITCIFSLQMVVKRVEGSIFEGCDCVEVK